MITEPLATPVTKPLAFTVAIAVLPLLQVPPPTPLLAKEILAPAHTVAGPLNVPAFGTSLMVILADPATVPHEPLTV